MVTSKIETIVYGGAFNPPTIAHQVILQTCVDYARKVGAEVWLLPSGDRTDKVINADEQRRVDYINAMREDVTSEGVNVEVVLTELKRTVLVETYDTVVEFNETFPDRSFVWVFGADSTQTMSAWKEGDWLLENTRMLLLERPGSTVNPAAKHAETLSIPVMDVSSTEVRRRIETGEDFSDLVGESVHRLLTK